MTQSSRLQKAREYETEKAKLIPEGQKPSFHICSPVGWINDPNGFSTYQGEYHLFYQYHPYDRHWGPMHWGHSKTKDFIKWEQLPCAIAPDEEYDGQGCFSGSALEMNDRQVLMYTGVTEKENEDGEKIVRQRQCIAIGDGINFEKLPENPVITAEMLPEGSSLADFRDPKIWEEDGVFYAVAGSLSEDGSGQIPLFESKDLKKWEFKGILAKCENRYGKMWECPDFFPLDEKHVLIVSPQFMTAKGLEFHGGNNTMYIIGNFRKKEARLEEEAIGSIDYGLDFYAPQTLQTEDGRRVMIGWLQNWDNYMTPDEFLWSGMMTIPRELQIKEGRLIQNPVRELENYRENERIYHGTTEEKQVCFEDVRGRTFDMTVEVSGEYEEFRIVLASDGKFYTTVTFDRKKGLLIFDRTYSGQRKDSICTRTMKAEEENGKLKMRILMDKYTLELFVNDGKQAMTSLIYTDLKADKIFFEGEGKAEFALTMYDIRV